VWVATAAALVLAVRGLARRTVRPWTLVIEASPLLCLFVLGLAVVVEAVSEHLLGGLLGTILPGSAGLPELLLTAVIAALLANLVNNLPATLILLSVLGSHPNTGVLLAVLLGVNIGTMDADEWAKTEAMPSGDEITRVRRIIDRMKGDLDEITEEERSGSTRRLPWSGGQGHVRRLGHASRPPARARPSAGAQRMTTSSSMIEGRRADSARRRQGVQRGDHVPKPAAWARSSLLFDTAARS